MSDDGKACCDTLSFLCGCCTWKTTDESCFSECKCVYNPCDPEHNASCAFLRCLFCPCVYLGILFSYGFRAVSR